ncbi:unnamed protein product [Trifolium pratense]|uniref:Uncharacterized protein n=2 Tax=Trifolium pratense TaxID=57577 RepID=A0ACB0I897_TRIPR|nr:unnamed protein product [Trifolium pratense]
MVASTNLFGQSSSSPFGSSQSVFGQQNNSSNKGRKRVFQVLPLGSQTGNSSTSAGVFGATQTLSPFSSNTTSSASSSPTFNSSMPAFGVSYTPSFGGLSCSGQKPAIGGVHSTPTQTSPFDSSAPFCASSQPTFGSTSTPAFGATSTPAFGATTIPTFGGSSGTASAFGDSSCPAFGASSTPAFSFGSPTQAFGQSSSALGTSSPFGSTNSAFGDQSYAFESHTPTKTFENTGIGQSEFGRRRGGSRVSSYSATTQPDGGSSETLRKFESISTMSIYNDKSHEELRWEDYQLGDKGGPLASTPQSTGMAGFKSYTTQKNAFSRLVFAQSSANPFSSTTPNSNNPFAPKTSTFSSGFGTSAPAFGSSAFDSSSTSAFGTSSSLASGSSSIPAFGGQSSVFGPQIHTQAFVGQRGGSRVASYSATTETEFGPGQPRKLESISAMPSYKDKSHDELRWEDYLLGTKAFGQSSSHPFGSSQSVFGQQNNSSVFGATQTLPPFSSNTTSASSSPAFNSSMPASGPSSTPAFGNSSSPFGVFGQKPAFGGFRSTPTQTNPFGSAIQPPQQAFGSNTLQLQPAFGSSIFGSTSTPAFGATSTPAFGSTSTPAFGATSTPAFGSTSTPAFGATSTPAYGATTPTFSFGSSTQAFGQSSSAFGTSSTFGSTTSAFGGQSSAFGSRTPTQTFENTGIGQSEFGRQRGGSRVASYSATTELDGCFGQPGKFESISTMSYYKDKSHEELRWEDYQLGDKGGPIASAPQSTGMAGFNSSTTKTDAFSPSPVFGQSSANPFSSTTPNSNNPFASKASSFSPGFGTSAPAFSSSAFGSSSTSAFETSSSFAFGASSIPGFSFGSSTKACGLSSSAFGTFYPFGDKDIRSGQTEKLESISAILLYNDKSHEELRWEDYQLGSSASTNAPSGSEFGRNTFPFGQMAGFSPSSFFNSLSSGLVGSIFSSRASPTSNAPDWAMSYQGRGSTVSLAVLTGTVLATVVVSGWISHRCWRA